MGNPNYEALFMAAGKKDQLADDALNAVEDALKIDFNNDTRSADEALGKLDSATRTLSDDARNSDDTRAGLTPAAPPANDIHSSGRAKLRAAIARKPSSITLWFATLLGLLWIGAAGWAGHKLFPQETLDVNAWKTLPDHPNLIYLTASVIIPLLLIWGFAIMIRRAQELKIAARSMTEVAYRLVEPESEAINEVRSVGQAIKLEVNALTDGLEKAVDRAGELETIVHNEVISLTSSYSENEMRMRGLVDELATERESIVTHSERVRSSISGASDALKEDLNISAKEIADSVIGAQQQFSVALSSTNDEVKASLGFAGESLVELLASKGDEISDRINLAGDGLVSRISKSGDGASAAIESKTNELANKINFLAENMQTTVTGRIDDAVGKLDERGLSLMSNVDKIETALDGRTRQISDTLVERTREIASAFADGHSAIQEDFDSQLTQTRDVLDDKALELSVSLAARVEEINQSIIAQVNHVDTKLSARVDSTEETLSTKLGEADQRLAARSEQIAQAITSQVDTVDEKMALRVAATEELLTSKLDETDQRLAARTENISQAITSQIDTVDEKITSRVAASSELLTSKLGETDERLATRTNEIIDNIGSLVDTADKRLLASSEDVKNAFEEHVGAIDLTLGTRADAINANLETSASKVNEMLAQRAQDLAVQLDTNLAGISNSLTGEAKIAEDSIASSIAAMEGKIGASVEKADGAIFARTEQLTKTLNERTAELNTTLAARSREISNILVKDTLPLLKNFESQGAAVSALMADKVRSAADGAADKLATAIVASNERMETAAQAAAEDLAARYMSIEGKTAELVGQLSKSSESLSNTVHSQSGKLVSDGDAMTRKMAEVATEVAERIRAEGSSMVDVLTIKSNESIEALSETNEKLAGEVGELLGRLDHSNSTLSTLITTADTNLSDAQELLATRATEFKQTVGLASDDLNSSSNLIEANYMGLKDVSATVLVEISEIANRFADQSEALNSVSRLLDETQSNIAISLDDRRDAIEALTNGLVAKSSELEDLMRSFTELMANSVTNAEDRAQSLTSGLAESVGAAATEATERFSAATGEMRNAAHDLRQDLAKTRDELKKSVIDLPDETRESTNAMRRVVSDQIKALKDLNDIVAKTPRYQDSAPSNVAASAPAQSFISTPTPPKRPAPIASRPAPKPPIPVRQPEPIRQPEVTESLRGGLSFEEPAERSAPQGQNSTGWVTDLLRRASQDEPEPQATPRGRAKSNDSLNSLSSEIAQSINHDAAVSLWDRYQRGERNVFNRDMYTPQGQKTFDDINGKYKSDEKFRESVDRYVTDFERLIADVSKNDRDNIMTQTYLVSDTGKVYTMLAHAAGRFS